MYIFYGDRRNYASQHLIVISIQGWVMYAAQSMNEDGVGPDWRTSPD